MTNSGILLGAVDNFHNALGKEAITLVVILVGRIAGLDHLVKVGQAVRIIVEICRGRRKTMFSLLVVGVCHRRKIFK